MTLVESTKQSNDLQQNQEAKDNSEDGCISEKSSSTFSDKEGSPKANNPASDFEKGKNQDDEIDVETYSENGEASPKEDNYLLERSIQSPEIESTLQDNQKSNEEDKKEEKIPTTSCKDAITTSDLTPNRASPIILNGKKLYRKFRNLIFFYILIKAKLIILKF